MERESELILRNRGHIDAAAVLIINPFADQCASELAHRGAAVRLLTQDYGSYQWHNARGADVVFGVTDETSAEALPFIILYLPREKARLTMLLHLACTQLSANGVLWLVGANHAGIKSARPRLERRFEKVDKLDAARHSVIYAAQRPICAAPFSLEDYFETWTLSRSGQNLILASLPGVFAHGRLDDGTELLLENLPELPRGQSLLDFGCGTGVIGLVAGLKSPELEVSLLDSNAMALESSHRSATINNLQVEIIASEGFSEVRQQYDWILSNPPFHQGVKTDFRIPRHFIQGATRHLHANGNIMLVANKHLPYRHWLEESFQSVTTVATNKAFKVLLAGKKKNRH